MYLSIKTRIELKASFQLWHWRDSVRLLIICGESSFDQVVASFPAIPRLIDRMPNNSRDVLTGQATIENGSDVDSVESQLRRERSQPLTLALCIKQEQGQHLTTD